MAGKKERQSQILDLLAAEGVTSGQSTISRDLRELGVLEGPSGYRPPPPGTSGRAALRRVAGDLSGGVLSADAAANLVVLKLSSPRAPSLSRRGSSGSSYPRSSSPPPWTGRRW